MKALCLAYTCFGDTPTFRSTSSPFICLLFIDNKSGGENKILVCIKNTQKVVSAVNGINLEDIPWYDVHGVGNIITIIIFDFDLLDSPKVVLELPF